MGIDKYTGLKTADGKFVRRPIEEIIREQEVKHLLAMGGNIIKPATSSGHRFGPKQVAKPKDQNPGLGTEAEPTYTASVGPVDVRIASGLATYAWAKLDLSMPLIGTTVRFFNAADDSCGKSLWKRDAEVVATAGLVDIIVRLHDDGHGAKVFRDWWMKTVFPVAPIIRIMPAEGMPVRFTPFRGSVDVFTGTVGVFKEMNGARGMYELTRDCDSSVKYEFDQSVWMQEVWPHTERF